MNVETPLSGTLTATTNGGAINVQHALSLVAHLNVTAVSGTTPSMTVKFQESLDGALWIDIPSAAFTAATATGSQRLEFATRAAMVRAVATISGTTPSFTFDTKLCGKL
jgi:hypothetical protein